MREDARYRVTDEDRIPSPALIYYPEIIRENTRLAIALSGGADRLWPHVKTHKMAEMVDMQLGMGIRRFKCATLPELELVCARGAQHALLAYPLLGPAVGHFLDVKSRYPGTACYAMGDSLEALTLLDAACRARDVTVDWLCDVNLGMDRTGVPVDSLCGFCAEAVRRFTNLRLVGLHCYDGQNHQSDPEERKRAVEEQMGRVRGARQALSARGISTPIVIAGGSPTFALHAAQEDAYLSPGTVFVWDWGYQQNYRELPFRPGAALLTRVVSHPAPGVFTLDLGYKAIASDPAGQRGCLLEGNGAYPLFQSEEHWTWRMPEGREALRPEIGQVMYVIPTHICPTTALYRAARVCEDGRLTGEWSVAARDRD